MAWADPSDPVPLTVITTAYAKANLLAQIRWLRLLTGNADPPGSNYVVISSGPAGSAWGKVTSDAMAAGAALANIANNSMNGDQKLIDGSVRGDAADSSISVLSIAGNRLVNDTMDPTQTLRAFAANSFVAATIAKLFGSGSFDATNVDAIIADQSINGDDKLISGSVRGDAAGSAISTDSVHANRIKAATFDETQVDRVFGAGAIDGDRLKTAGVTSAQMAAGAAAANIGTGGVTTAMHADSSVTEPKLDISNSPTDGYQLAWNSGAGKFSWVAPPSGTTGVPSGLIAFFSSPVALAAATGWVAYSAADGRLIVAAGTAFSVTFAAATNYGSSWSHNHAGNTWGGSGSTTSTTAAVGPTNIGATDLGQTDAGKSTTAANATGSTGDATGSTVTDNLKTVTPEEADASAKSHVHSATSIGIPALPIPQLDIPHLGIPQLTIPNMTIPSLSATVSVSGDTAATQVIPPIHALLAAQKS